MKLVNKDGRFEFIKNDLVMIDKSLLKYQKLDIAKKNLNNQRNTNDSGQGEYIITDETQDVAHVPVQDTPNNPNNPDDVNSELGTNISYYNSAYGGVDGLLRMFVLKMHKSNSLRTFLQSESAMSVNSKFKDILLKEIAYGPSSRNITYGRWQPLDDDSSIEFVTTPETDSDPAGQTLWQKLKSKLFKKSDNLPKKTSFTILELFDILHIKQGHETDFLKRMDGYCKILEKAEITGQIALADEISQKILINIYESILKVHGFDKYISFKQLEDLQNKCDKIIDIDYLSKFGRMIPDEIAEKKKFADELCVFDNYCVIYYDPSGKSHKEEAVAKRDPILFGLINHSSKMYYIGSWVDELCDLTLETIADKLGANAIKQIPDAISDNNV